MRSRSTRHFATIGGAGGPAPTIHHSTTGGRAIYGANRLTMTMVAEPTSCVLYAATAAVSAFHWGI